MRTLADYERIDALPAVSQIQTALKALDPASRKLVILMALRKSRCQWTWSYMASYFSVPESEWPPRARVLRGLPSQVTYCSDCGKLGETAGHQDCQYPQNHG